MENNPIAVETLGSESFRQCNGGISPRSKWTVTAAEAIMLMLVRDVR